MEIEAIVILPEHLHARWRLPVDDADFSTRWMLIRQSFTRTLRARGLVDETEGWSRGRTGERVVWQRRFWEHQKRDEEDFERHVDDIHFNPVKHGWAMRAVDWQWSSLHRFVREGRRKADVGLGAALDGQFGE